MRCSLLNKTLQLINLLPHDPLAESSIITSLSCIVHDEGGEVLTELSAACLFALVGPGRRRVRYPEGG